MKKTYYDTMTSFEENSKIKKLWQSYCDENGIKYSDFIRNAMYKSAKLKPKRY